MLIRLATFVLALLCAASVAVALGLIMWASRR